MADLNLSQIATLIVVFSSMSVGGIWMAGRVYFGFEGGRDRL